MFRFATLLLALGLALPAGAQTLKIATLAPDGSSWMRELREPTLAITHRGVIRVTLAAATGWDMLGKPPAKLDWTAVHFFDVDEEGRPRVRELNVK